jgi:uncharacterized protein YyaL (SSP411 family)
MSDIKGIPNKLIDEKSPYLLQHAYNPVNWYPWGEEAFAKAKAEDKPVFLSIGYSTCHWCHVMERESFEDKEVAELINKNFVAIKVDREERPDIDHIYMDVCQSITGRGGWPLTVVLTPEQQPFFVGTYFPKTSREGFPGLMHILTVLDQHWREKRQTVLAEIAEISKAASRRLHLKSSNLSRNTLDKAYDSMANNFDVVNGGFGLAPKFPMPHQLLFLLRYYALTGKEQALLMVKETLDSMSRGGIYDQLGYGFSRYSVDAEWHAPHFEKMLYDNALLAYIYTETFQATRDPHYKEIAEQIFVYEQRDMLDKTGGFYSAEDADSEGHEGKFYLWSQDEIIDILGSEGQLFADFYSVTPQGNFEAAANILYFTKENISEFAISRGIEPADLQMKLAEYRHKLWQQREKRVHPHKDDKILLGWNALFIASLAKGAKVFDNQDYLKLAEETLKSLQTLLRRPDGRWLARYRDGEAAYLAYLDDYAYLCWALLELYEASLDFSYIAEAVKLCEQVVELFTDQKHGGFYFYGHDSETLLRRPKEYSDGALPSGNSVMAWCLAKICRLTQQPKWESLLTKLLASISGEIAQYPQGYSFLLQTLLYQGKPPQQAVIAGWQKHEATAALLKTCQASYQPFLDVVLAEEDSRQESVALFPQLADYPIRDNQATAYVCENYQCQLPVHTPAELDQLFVTTFSKKMDKRQ